MTTTNLNAQALANSARECIGYAQSTKWTIAKIVNHWNLCVEQSGLTGVFDFPSDYKRKAHLIADLERCVEQLTNIAEGRDALENAPVEAAVEAAHSVYKKVEVMVQDVQKGMVVVNPVSGEHNTVNYVDDFSCYFIISFSGDMHQHYFDRGETLMVCEPVEGSQITNVIPSKEEIVMPTIFEHLLNIESVAVGDIAPNKWFINETGSLCKRIESSIENGYCEYVDFRGNVFSVASTTPMHPVTNAMSEQLNG